MGVFGGLFKKKECAICGGEIGLLGNRKLEDGNMCKSCAKKLSPWFEDRRQSTVADIEAQLRYREENRQAVADFCVTRTFGEGWELQVDDRQGRFMIVRTGKPEEENPDVLELDQVTGVVIDIDESRSEQKREDKDGNQVSYVPPRYDYSYDFNIIVKVRHPYFDDMKLQVNRHTLEIEGIIGKGSTGDYACRNDRRFRAYEEQCQEISAVLLRQNMNDSSASQPQNMPENHPDTLRQSAEPALDNAAPTECPACGAPAGTGKFCESCGSPLR